MINSEELKRYSRHLLLDDIGEAGQQKLAKSRVLVIGLGGLGSPVTMYLAAAGVGKLLIADGDRLDVTNLQRQIMFDTKGVGELKAELAEQRISGLNPMVDLEVIDQQLTEDELVEYVPEVDLVLDCSDNLDTRRAVNRVCRQNSVPLVAAAAIRWEGHLMVFDFRQPTTPCYECLYPLGGAEPVLNCSTSGVVGPVLGILGSMQALEATKLLLGMTSDINGQLKIFDGKHHQWNSFAITRKQGCPVCMGSSGI
ncbi:MAG: HesA/MoeB/ThiF family protein [Porticoccaceae bacterium]